MFKIHFKAAVPGLLIVYDNYIFKKCTTDHLSDLTGQKLPSKIFLLESSLTKGKDTAFLLIAS